MESPEIENIADSAREHGEQPLTAVMARYGVTNHQLVAVSTEQLTHKMVAKACRGRELSTKVRLKIVRALNRLTGESCTLRDLFNY